MPEIDPRLLDLKSRLLDQVTVEDDCWTWQGRIDKDGYALWDLRNVNGKRESRASRISFILFNGEIESHLQIDHLCRRRDCVNPDHLDLVTGDENMLRSRKEKCKSGHEFTDDNTYWYFNNRGRRVRACRECKREAVRRFRGKS